MTLLNKIIEAIFGKSAEAKLDEKAAAHGEKLDWRKSIVDLLDLLERPSDLDSRKELAKELHYSGPLDGSSAMNRYTHKRVLEGLGIYL